jgi:pimeloyl-[acyl-carrier protein] methyl ester esterase
LKRFIFISGFSQPAYILEPLCEELSKSGQCVLSSVTDFAQSKLNSDIPYKESMRSLIDPCSENILIAWSMAGTVCLDLIAEQIESVSAVVMMGATARFLEAQDYSIGVEQPRMQALVRGIKQEKQHTFERFFTAMNFPQEQGERKDQLIRCALSVPDELLLDNLSYLEASDFRSKLDQIETPCLLMHGALDKVIPPEHSNYMSVRIPHSRQLSFPQSGHLLFLDNLPVAAAEIKQFLGC